MLHKYSEQELRTMGVADFHIEEMKRELKSGGVEHLLVFDYIGAWKWTQHDIFKLLEKYDKVKARTTGLCNKDCTEYSIYFEIHPLERENFREKILPKIYEVCNKNGNKAIWL